MNNLLFYNGKDHCVSVWLEDVNSAMHIYTAMKKTGWKAVWMQHATDQCVPFPGLEQELKDWQDECKRN